LWLRELCLMLFELLAWTSQKGHQKMIGCVRQFHSVTPECSTTEQREAVCRRETRQRGQKRKGDDLKQKKQKLAELKAEAAALSQSVYFSSDITFIMQCTISVDILLLFMLDVEQAEKLNCIYCQLVCIVELGSQSYVPHSHILWSSVSRLQC